MQKIVSESSAAKLIMATFSMCMVSVPAYLILQIDRSTICWIDR